MGRIIRPQHADFPTRRHPPGYRTQVPLRIPQRVQPLATSALCILDLPCKPIKTFALVSLGWQLVLDQLLPAVQTSRLCCEMEALPGGPPKGEQCSPSTSALPPHLIPSLTDSAASSTFFLGQSGQMSILSRGNHSSRKRNRR